MIGILLYACIGCVTALAAKSKSLPPTPLATIPLEPYLGEQTEVHAVVNGQLGTFLFDTGEGVSSFSQDFAKKVGCRPWGRITGFRMSGERLDAQHCDEISFDLFGQKFRAPVVGIIDIMKFLGPDVPTVDGALGLDIFAGRIITIIPRKAIIVESAASLAVRLRSAREVPVRIVRDAEGVAMAVDAAVRTSAGLAWMELDTGNGGSLVVADHIAPLMGLQADMQTPQLGHFELANGITVEGMMRTRDLIMDGNIGAHFLNNWILILDLQQGRAWLDALPDKPGSTKRQPTTSDEQ